MPFPKLTLPKKITSPTLILPRALFFSNIAGGYRTPTLILDSQIHVKLLISPGKDFGTAKGSKHTYSVIVTS